MASLYYDMWVYTALCVFGWAALACALRIYAIPLYGTELCQGYPAWRCKSCPLKRELTPLGNGSIEVNHSRYTPTLHIYSYPPNSHHPNWYVSIHYSGKVDKVK